MTEKRGFSTLEAHEYVGLKRRAFDLYMVPHLVGKGVKVGVSVVYEKADLDAAWEKVKLSVGEGRSGQKGDSEWGEKERPVFTRTAKAGKSMPSTKGKAFASAVSELRPRQKAS